MRYILISIAVVMLSGCLAHQSTRVPPAKMVTIFNEIDHDKYVAPGTGIISGQGFLRQKGGGVVTCAGSKVMMLPATEFFREAIGYLRNRQTIETSPITNPKYKPLMKTSQCDAQGNFAISDLPSGAWLLMTEVAWNVGYNQQGGALLKEVNSKNGETVRVLLSDDEYIGR